MAQQQSTDNEHLTAVRETFESVWIAIVLAFVLRAFVIEAFVIPTGSMAPRLMGRHWEFDCPACAYHYTTGIGSTAEDKDLTQQVPAREAATAPGGPPAQCPNCRYPYHFGTDWAFGGDRVLVLKYLYRFREPRPWDVVVFKNPQDNEQNYIKRLIGLPGQLLEIIHGDVYVRQGKDLNGDGVIDEHDFYYFSGKSGKELESLLDPNPSGDPDQNRTKLEFTQNCLADPRFNETFPARILTKDAQTQRVMWQIIFDNDYQPDPVVYGDRGERGKKKSQPGQTDGPPRQEWYQPWSFEGDAWRRERELRDRELRDREFRFNGSRNFAAVKFSNKPEYFLPTNPYNAGHVSDRSINSDLKLSFTYVPEAAESSIGLHLSAFDDHFLATVSAEGQCVLTHGRGGHDRVEWDAGPLLPPVVLPAMKPGQPVELALSLADYRVTLWVNGKAVLATTPQQYNPAHNLANMRKAAEQAGNEQDRLAQLIYPLTPVPTVEFMGQGGPCTLLHVRLMADVYYTQATLNGVVPQHLGHATMSNPMVLRKFGKDPDDRDEFFVLGDNSPQSLDARMWSHHASTLRAGYRDGTVARYAMIGKAFFVYWPGGFRAPMIWPKGDVRDWVVQLPYIPNAGRMRLIR